MENQEREISIGKLLWKIILSWRLLLVWAFVFVVLVSGVFYLKEYKSYKAALNWKPAATEAEEKVYQFTDEEEEALQNAQKLQEWMEENQEYMKESVLMNIDPYAENALVLRYYVESDYSFNYTEDNRLDYTSAVTASYGEYVQSGVLAEKISEALGLDYDIKYIQELIRVGESSSERVFNIEIVYPEQEVLWEMADIVKTEMNSQIAEISEKVGKHSLKLLSENVLVRTDSDLASQKKSYNDMLYSSRTQLNTLKSSMTPEQLEKLGAERMAAKGKVASEEEVQQVAPVAVKPSLHAKYVLLGLVAGIFLAVIWIVYRVLFTAILQESMELTEFYGLRVFGTLEKHGKLSGLDKLLLKWKNRHKKQMTEEQSLDIISSNIELTCESEKISSIYLTGSEIEKVDKEWINQITARLEQAGIAVVYGENICYDAASLRKVTEVGSAVLVEQAGVSKYQEIKKEIMIITEQKVKVLGCIGIDAVGV